MSYKVKGIIKTISKPETVGNAKKLFFRIDNGEQYNNIMEFELYKGAEYVDHIDNFTKYNKVGDSVDVEFNIKTFNWKPESEDKIFTSLSCWKVTKAESDNLDTNQNFETTTDVNEIEEDGLPF